MKLSISNIAWDAGHDEEMYAFLKEQGFCGLEIAPTRIFPDKPYQHLKEAKDFSAMLKSKYGLSISSMQSIWFGKSESIFGTSEEQRLLIDYTKKAVDFAKAAECRNLVFGNPRNRNKPEGASVDSAFRFFGEIADYAVRHGTVIALEPNPAIYFTNFLNSTSEAFAFAKQVRGLALNVDIGTIIENDENLQVIADNIAMVNHVHISEPYLEEIKKRSLHNELFAILKKGSYEKYVSIEMKNFGCLETVKRTAEYIRTVFHEL
ncbi:MAG: sugar phosphate isomerase/epimerase [Lachnospiraceae bacterium]|nr:sugar phosphate isomerase/epimerase [Lachnospiraceae bacterium]